jgi:hypothetical protein
MACVGTYEIALIYRLREGNATGAGLVPSELFDTLNAWKISLDCGTEWFDSTHPVTGERLQAFTPIANGRRTIIESQGIGHGDQFRATIEMREVNRHGTIQRQMWLVGARPL